MVACIKWVAQQVIEDSKGKKKSITQRDLGGGMWKCNKLLRKRRMIRELYLQVRRKHQVYRTWNGITV